MKKMNFIKEFLIVLILLFATTVYCKDHSVVKNTPKETTEQSSKQTYLSLRQQYSIKIDLKEVFLASPTIYSLLFFMSIASVSIWIYSIFTFRAKETIP